jgi:hypothetical protein
MGQELLCNLKISTVCVHRFLHKWFGASKCIFRFEGHHPLPLAADNHHRPQRQQRKSEHLSRLGLGQMSGRPFLTILTLLMLAPVQSKWRLILFTPQSRLKLKEEVSTPHHGGMVCGRVKVSCFVIRKVLWEI